MESYDIIIVSGEYYVDHPLSPVGVIVKVLRDKGLKVGVIEKPDWKKDDDFLRLGKPKLFFGVTSGSIDSMMVNYTPMKHKRSEDKYKPYDSKMPDRAIITYCNKLKQLFKGSMIVIGGIEASMRRFAHYDYWENNIRRGILYDARADILVYGNGEYQVIEIANRIKEGKSIEGIEGTCLISNAVPTGFELLPSFEQIKDDKKAFCKMQTMFSNNKDLAQESNKRYALQYKMHNYTSEELDYIYGLDYSRDIPKYYPEFRMAQFSVVTHRGCIGNCNFCSIGLHQGNRIISRSEKSILEEIRKITKHKDFKGFIDDLGGSSANMYGMDCARCDKPDCLRCKSLDKTHSRLLHLLRTARNIPGIRKVFIRSGIRYDLALNSEEYVREISKHHISGCLKIAPEHVSDTVLELMNKKLGRLKEFQRMFAKYNMQTKQDLRYYFMTAHPGSSMKEVQELATALRQIGHVNDIQIFTPTPMTVSTCMYWTGLNPYTLKEVYVPYTYHEKKQQKNVLYPPEKD